MSNSYLNKLLFLASLVLILDFSLQNKFQLNLLIQKSAAQEVPENMTLRDRIKQRRANRQIEKSEINNAQANGEKIEIAGDYEFNLIHDGIKRLYKVHVPKHYRTNVASPMLVAFHGGGGDMHYQSNDAYYGLITASEEKNFIAVFPNGYSQFNSGKFATWNAGNCCAKARDQQIDDVGFVKKMILEVNQKFNINQERIFATGMSNGAMMTYRLACEMADTFKAIAAVAGTDNTISCKPSKPVSILHIHAKNDDHVQYEGGAGKNAVDISKITEFTSVPASIAKWVKLNHCEAKPNISLKNEGAICEKYSACSGNTEVKVCTTETGGHSWPGGNKVRGKEPTSKAISANEVIWDFFMHQ